MTKISRLFSFFKQKLGVQINKHSALILTTFTQIAEAALSMLKSYFKHA